MMEQKTLEQLKIEELEKRIEKAEEKITKLEDKIERYENRRVCVEEYKKHREYNKKDIKNER